MSQHRARLLMAIAASMMADLSLPPPAKPRIYTHADEERQRKAEAKRARKAAKRQKGKQ